VPEPPRQSRVQSRTDKSRWLLFLGFPNFPNAVVPTVMCVNLRFSRYSIAARRGRDKNGQALKQAALAARRS
jgi:hypothetical protein